MISNELQAYLILGTVKLPKNFMHFTAFQKADWLRRTIEIRKATNQHTSCISISKEQLDYVDDTFLRTIRKYIRDGVFSIDVSHSGLFTREEFEKIAKINEKVEKMGSKFLFTEMSTFYEFERACEANNKINSWAEQINSLKIDGKELSPLEKFYVAYSYVTRFEYREAKGNLANSRGLISTLSGNEIVCVGYASILKELCKKIGIECDTQSISVNAADANHMNCSVKINDPKYGVNGIFYSDPCFDSNHSGKVSIANALISYNDLKKIFVTDFVHVTKIEDEYENKSLDKVKEKGEEKDFNKKLSDFLLSNKENLFDYVDKAVEGYKGALIPAIPTKKDLRELIDSYICNELSTYNYGKNKSYGGKLLGIARDTNLTLFTEKVLRFTRVKNIEKFKQKLGEAMNDYLPPVNSIAYGRLCDTYSRYAQNEVDSENDKLKSETIDLSYVQFKKLLGNLEKIEGEMEVNPYTDCNKLLINSAQRANEYWGTFRCGKNVFCEIARLYTIDVRENGWYAKKTGYDLLNETIALQKKYREQEEAKKAKTVSSEPGERE